MENINNSMSQLGTQSLHISSQYLQGDPLAYYTNCFIIVFILLCIHSYTFAGKDDILKVIPCLKSSIHLPGNFEIFMKSIVTDTTSREVMRS